MNILFCGVFGCIVLLSCYGYYSAASIEKYTACAKYRILPVTFWINLFYIFQGGGKSCLIQNILILFRSLVLCVDAVDLVFFGGNYVGIVLDIPQRSLAWICESRVFCRPSLMSCPGIFSLTNNMIWCSFC